MNTTEPIQAVTVGYFVGDEQPTYAEMAAETPRAYMRVWCARNGIEGEREAA